MSVEVKLRNPYLDAFDKYMVFKDWGDGWTEWEERTDWVYGDGFGGEKWHRHGDDMINARRARDQLRSRCAFAVPTGGAIAAIAALEMPVVEIGAGTGYWAWLLEQAGVEVVAFDKHPDEKNGYCCEEHWTTVRRGDHRVLPAYPNHALMLCWPPNGSPMAARCLRAYPGSTLIYIGEWDGCCADDSFFAMAEEAWDLEREVSIPQWMGMHDNLSILRRRA